MTTYIAHEMIPFMMRLLQAGAWESALLPRIPGLDNLNHVFLVLSCMAFGNNKRKIFKARKFNIIHFKTVF